MPRREMEGGWTMGWPDRKRPALIAAKDAQGRIINGRSPLTEIEGLITPTDAYYIVNQLEVPEPIHPDDWVLTITGEVDLPMHMSLSDLRKLPGRTVRAVTECAGNDAGFFDYQLRGGKKPSRINQQDMQKRLKRGALGSALIAEETSSEATTTCAVSAGEFTGVSLAEVLRKTRIKTGSVSVLLQGLDRGQPDLSVQYRSVGHSDFQPIDPGIINFEKALPLEKALHPDTLLAWAMNGEYLLHLHGAPVRAVVPGWSGNWWVKWLQKLEVLDRMPELYYQNQYFVYGNSPEDPNKTPITAMGVRCVITDPLDEDSPLEQGMHKIVGRAWSGMGTIVQVEVSLDDGKTWSNAHIEEPRDKWLWIRWSYLWDASMPGKYRIIARATDETGRVQPQIPWNYQRKHFDGIVPTTIVIE